MTSVDVDYSGPIFDGRAAAAVTAFCHAAEHDIAQRGVNLVHAALGTSLRHPTGYYESHVVSDRSGSGYEVTDGGVVYGPWLEGVGSRNRTTRFKGYASFRRASATLDREAEGVAERTLPPYLARMQ
jgi:hypothetical protein